MSRSALPIEFHSVTREDINELSGIELESQAWPWTKEQLLFEVSEQARGNGAFSLMALIKTDSQRAGASSLTEPAGYFFARIAADEAEILNLVVARSFRRLGIGSALLKRAIQLSADRGALQVFLEVREGNDAARLLYKKHGFLESGLRKGYYRDNNEDAILMTLPLNSQ